MNDNNKLVMANVISGVETGGQRYGYGRWDDYTRPYKNTSGEHTCTLGAFQFYGDEGRELCNLIFNKNENLFKSLDICYPSIESMLNKDWVSIRWYPSSSQASVLSAIISTDVGIQCQKELFVEKQLNKYVDNAIQFGVNDVKAQMMWVEIQHLGGGNAPKRVFKRCGGNYSVDNILACLNPKYADYNKYSNPVEAGMFWSRHVCCATWIKKYAEDENGSTTKKYLSIGNSGDDVSILQEKLMLVGLCDCVYYENVDKFVDGDFGNETRKSVIAVQKINNLKEDGIYGEQTDKALNNMLKPIEEMKNSKFTITVDEFLAKAKAVSDFVRKQKYKYGNSAFLPSIYKYEKYVSCDRFVDMVLWESGYKNIGNRRIQGLEEYLAKICKKINNKSDSEAGDIVFYKGHVFILGKNKGNGLYERYDCGSESRIQSIQPSIENIDGFIYAYRLPFATNKNIDATDTVETRLVKSGQIHLNNYIGANLSVDGVYGINTNMAFIKALQVALNKDYGYKLNVNGKFDTDTVNAIKAHPVTIHTTKKNIVIALAIGLYINKIEPYGLTLSENLINALKKYQKKHKLYVDGAAGISTFKSLATIK